MLVYLQERGPSLRNLRNLEGQFAVMFAAYTGRPITDLPAVAREYASQQAGTLSPGTIRNRIAYLRAACRYAWKHHAMTEHDRPRDWWCPRSTTRARSIWAQPGAGHLPPHQQPPGQSCRMGCLLQRHALLRGAGR